MPSRCAAATSSSGQLPATTTSSRPAPASSASRSRAASRTSVPGSAPGPLPSTLMPASPPRAKSAIVAIRAPVGDERERHVEGLVGTDGVDAAVTPSGASARTRSASPSP